MHIFYEPPMDEVSSQHTTPDYFADIIWFYRGRALGYLVAAVISVAALFFGIMKFGWIQALWTTLKNIWKEFRGSLDRSWAFFSAGYKPVEETSEE